MRFRQVRLGSSGCAPPQPTQNGARKNERRFCIECPSPSRVRETRQTGLRQLRVARHIAVATSRRGPNATHRHARFALCAPRRGGADRREGSLRASAHFALPSHRRILEDQSAAQGADPRRRRRNGADGFGRHSRLSGDRISAGRRADAVGAASAPARASRDGARPDGHGKGRPASLRAGVASAGKAARSVDRAGHGPARRGTRGARRRSAAERLDRRESSGSPTSPRFAP